MTKGHAHILAADNYTTIEPFFNVSITFRPKLPLAVENHNQNYFTWEKYCFNKTVMKFFLAQSVQSKFSDFEQEFEFVF